MIKLPESKTFTVYEDKWVHGGNLNRSEGPAENLSLLYNEQGNSCCVGHFLRDCGVVLENIKNAGYCTHLKCAEAGIPIEWEGIMMENEIYSINDDKRLPLRNRKSLLKDAFKKAFDVDIVFKPTSSKE